VRTRTVLLPGWIQPPPVVGIEVVSWDSGEPVPAQDVLDRVEFFVPPYLAPKSDIALAERMPRLRVVQALMAGVDGMLAVIPPGVTLLRARGVHDTSTAELAVGLILSAQRGIDVAARDMLSGTWRHERRRSLADSHVGIIGWGGVGRAVAARLAAFDVTVSGFSRSGAHGSRPVAALDRVLGELDIVVLAIPLTDQTRTFLSADRLAQMKDGALLVNVGRGELVDTAALTAQLQRGRLRAALDVVDPEPLPPDHPLWRAPGVLITPHLGGDSEAFVPRAQRMVHEQLQLFASGALD
jgi:phosphoglycerate dehydrogenase-like enzyme